MSLILKLLTAAGLGAAALWSAATVPVTPAAPAAPFGDGVAIGHAITDTLALDVALGQLVVAPASAPGLDALVAGGQIGRVEVPGGTVEGHLARLHRWETLGGLPVALGALPDAAFDGAPPPPSPAVLAAAGRPDLAFMAGRALAEASVSLGVQWPSTGLVLDEASADGARGEAIAQSLVRGVREGRALPSAVVADRAGLAALDGLAAAGLMEVRVRGDASLVRDVKARGTFGGLVVADLGRTATGAVAAVVAGADAVASGAPQAVYDSLAEGVRTGRLTPAVVREASRRVLAAKAWAGLDLRPPAPLGADGEGPVLRISPWRAPSAAFAHRVGLLDAELARRAVAVVQPAGGPLPVVGPDGGAVFTLLLDPGADPDRGLPFVNALALGLDRRAGYARLGLGDPEDRYADALRAAAGAELVVLAAFPDADGGLAPRHRAFVRALNGRTPTVLVTFGDARLAGGLRAPEALVVAHAPTEVAQRAAAEAIAGQIDVSGTLARGVPGVAPAGAGVRYRQQVLRPGAADEAGLGRAAAERVDRVMTEAVASGAFPGGAVAVGRDGVLVRLRGYGRLSEGGARVTPETAYDLASLTKVVGTTAVAMQLVDEGRLDLDARVSSYLPRYRSLGKEFVTVRQLLAHTAGHRPWWPFHANGQLTRRAALDFIYADTLLYPPGTRSRYSDFDMIVLGEVIAEIEDAPLDEVFERRVFGPLGMTATGFRRVGDYDPAAAPTEVDRAWRGRALQGEVHDEAASVFGGVAGHAGLFSTAEDMARFGFAMASGGQGYGARVAQRTTLEAFSERVRLPSTYPTGLGWMVNHGETSAGRHFGPRAFGHTGFTGTSIWIDPDQRLFVVLLTNRVHPTRRNRRIRDVRPALADAVAGAVLAPPGEAPTAWGFGPVPDDLPTVAAR